jgi:hypothetical protein
MRRLVPLLLLAAAAAGCGGSSRPSTTLSTPSGVVNATVQEIQAYPGRYAGATVVVGAGMGRKLQAHAFTVAVGARQRTRLANKGLLVVAKTVPAARPGQILKIRGRVLLFRPASAKREIPLPIDVAKLEPFDRRPVLVASSVTVR